MTTHMTGTREQWLAARLALLTPILGGGAEMLCSATQSASLPSGMVSMYVLMSAFHCAPWLKLISGRRSASRS